MIGQTQIDFCVYTNVGGKAVNEDTCAISDKGLVKAAVLCDGVGGHGCGDAASAAAAHRIIGGVPNLTAVTPDWIHETVNSANDLILAGQKTDKLHSAMGTTVVGMMLEGNRMHYFNCGDSRFYFFRNGSLKHMTKDHSVPQLSVDMGEITFDDIRFNVNRNRLLKALGQPYDGNAATVYPPILDVHKGDAFLLCSDGFWEYVYETEMEIDLSKSCTSEEWVRLMLVRLCLRMTTDNDNFSVIAGMMV